MTQDDHGYYTIRAKQEDAAARSAACNAARERHEELADAYRFRCELIRGLFGSTNPERSPAGAWQWANASPATAVSSAVTTAAVIA